MIAQTQPKTTPLLAQYFEIKEKHVDAILLFQVGDFFELFFEDAKVVSQALSITLTKRGKHNGQDIPICGVPVSSILYHLSKLVRQGFKVAVCEQVSKPIPGEIVDRRVTRVLSPGTLTDDLMLDEKKNSFLCSLWPLGDGVGIIFAELLTAKIFATKIPGNQLRLLDSELIRFFPDEILLPNLNEVKSLQQHLSKVGYNASLISPISEEQQQSIEQGNLTTSKSYDFETNKILKEYLNTKLSSVVFENILSDQSLAGSFALLTSYLHAYHDNFLPLVEKVNFYRPDDYLILDSITLKNLEVVRNNYDGTSKHSLFASVDKCMTGMGSRMLKQSLVFPIKNLEVLRNRTTFVGILKHSFFNLSYLEDLLSTLCDLERITGRIALSQASHQDFLNLKKTLSTANKIRQFLSQIDTVLAEELSNKIPNLISLQTLLEVSLSDDFLSDRKIKPGFNPELDSKHLFINNTEKEILNFEHQEVLRTKINNLKIKYTDISGYFFEINSNQIKNIPEDYKLLQSLTGRSRFINQALKALEYTILNAQQDLAKLEEMAFASVKLQTFQYLSQLRMVSHSLGYLDMLFSFAKTAYDRNYCQPTFSETSDILEIKEGRHPVIELTQNNNFIPNNTSFDENNRLMIITGPNMGGKSTYLRQVAQISLLAHTGSFVPASSCNIKIMDRIFTRIGSGDNLAAGKSTFFIEMEEVSLICDLATKNSLVILDEVGRGTSTFDGMAIAQAILEYLLDVVKSKALFATHYHELTELVQTKPSAKNFHLECKEINGNLIFSHKLFEGALGESFGIAVAKLAGISPSILIRAKELLSKLG